MPAPGSRCTASSQLALRIGFPARCSLLLPRLCDMELSQFELLGSLAQLSRIPFIAVRDGAGSFAKRCIIRVSHTPGFTGMLAGKGGICELLDLPRRL